MNSYVRSPRVTAQGTEETEATEAKEEEEGITQMAVPMLPRPLYMAVAPTMVEGVGGEAMATALDMAPTQSSPMPLRLIQSAEMSSVTGLLLERTRTGRGRGREAPDHKEMVAGGLDPAEAEGGLEDGEEEEEEDTATALQGISTMRITTPTVLQRQTLRLTRQLIQMLASQTCLQIAAEDRGGVEQMRTPH